MTLLMQLLQQNESVFWYFTKCNGCTKGKKAIYPALGLILMLMHPSGINFPDIELGKLSLL
jgi:hypothetical protein